MKNPKISYDIKIVIGELDYVQKMSDEILENIPSTFSLSQNYPNPFNPLTKFVYTINNPGVASLKIYDVTGKLIYTVFDAYREIGTFEEEWRSIDENNQA